MFGRRAQYSHVKYHGGHPKHPGPGRIEGVLVFDDNGVHYRVLREVFVIPWREVTGVSVEGPDLPQQRVTMTRMAMMGPFAWAAKKTTSDVYLHVDTSGFAVGFQIPKTSAGALNSTLGAWTAHLRPRTPPDVQPVPTVPPPPPIRHRSVADELAKLAELHRRGALSAEEFKAAKERLLN